MGGGNPRVGLLKLILATPVNGRTTLTVTITHDSHIKGPNLLKSQEFPGALPPGPPARALPLHPAKGPIGGPRTPPTQRLAHT